MTKKYNNNNLINNYFCSKVSKLGGLTPVVKKLEYFCRFNKFSINKPRNYRIDLGMIYKIISINKISHTLPKGRMMNYKVVSCCGCRAGWIGLGTYIGTKFFDSVKLSKFKSIDNIYIMRYNYKVNVVNLFKYKGCKIKFVNMVRDKFKLMRIVNSIHSVLGQNKFNLISFCSKNTNVLIKLLLNSLVSFN